MVDNAALGILENKQLRLAKIGIFAGLLSGMLWGASGTVLWEGLNYNPFASLSPDSAAVASKLVASGMSAEAAAAKAATVTLLFSVASGLALAFLHDFFATLWVLGFNGIKGKIKEYGRSLRTKPGKMVCVAAIMGGPMGLGCYLLALALAGPVYSLPITASFPALAAVMSFVFLKERNPARVWIGVVACICGSLTVAWGDPGVYPHFRLGIGLAVIACVGWASEGLLSTYGMDMLDPDVALGIREICSCLMFGLIVLPALGWYLATAQITETVTAWDLVKATLTSPGDKALWCCIVGALFGAFSYIFWYRALNTTGVARAMAFNATYAFWGVFFGFAMAKFMGRDAHITIQAWIGASVICLGAVLVSAHPKELFKLRDA